MKPDEVEVRLLGPGDGGVLARVAPAYQRRGIGKRVLAALLEHGRALGCTEAWLGAEESNIAARRLYVSAGAEEAPMVYVTFELGRKSPSAEQASSCRSDQAVNRDPGRRKCE